MGYRRTPFAFDEWYHCFNRGIDKRTVFESEDDSRRFIQLLYLANDTAPIRRENFYHLPHDRILQLPRERTIVAIGAYCLMGNHFHLLVREISDGGITRFMQKVGTGYAMYFNEKHDRIGNLFVKPFRSKHIGDDDYLRRVTQYIHLNPAERFESAWKDGKVNNMQILEKDLRTYSFSSLPDYFGTGRCERRILDEKAINLIAEGLPTLSVMLAEARSYYEQIEREF